MVLERHFVKKYINDPRSLASFTECVARELGSDAMETLIIKAINEIADTNW